MVRKIEIDPEAVKSLKKIPRDGQRRILRKLEEYGEKPGLIAATAFTFEGSSLSGRSANHATWEERLVRYGRDILRTPFVQPRQPSYFKHRHFESQDSNR